MLQEFKGVGYAWERAKTVAKNRVRWRILVDALCPPPPGGSKGIMMTALSSNLRLKWHSTDFHLEVLPVSESD